MTTKIKSIVSNLELRIREDQDIKTGNEGFSIVIFNTNLNKITHTILIHELMDDNVSIVIHNHKEEI